MTSIKGRSGRALVGALSAVVLVCVAAACGGSSTHSTTTQSASAPSSTTPSTTSSTTPSTTSSTTSSGGASPTTSGGASPTSAKTATITTGPVRAKLVGPDHKPKAGKLWTYSLHVSDAAGHPLSGTVEVEFVLAGPGIVVGKDTPPVHKLRGGALKEGLTFPSAAIGQPISLVTVVHTGAGSVALAWPVSVRK